jgi:hypothetical protein
VKLPDARGWIGAGCYILVIILLAMMWSDKALLKDDFFKVIATAIILSGWNNGPVGWAYQATKGGAEAAESNARIAEEAATAKVQGDRKSQNVVVTNPPEKPVPTKAAKGTKP